MDKMTLRDLKPGKTARIESVGGEGARPAFPLDREGDMGVLYRGSEQSYFVGAVTAAVHVVDVGGDSGVAAARRGGELRALEERVYDIALGLRQRLDRQRDAGGVGGGGGGVSDEIGKLPEAVGETPPFGDLPRSSRTEHHRFYSDGAARPESGPHISLDTGLGIRPVDRHRRRNEAVRGLASDPFGVELTHELRQPLFGDLRGVAEAAFDVVETGRGR